MPERRPRLTPGLRIVPGGEVADMTPLLRAAIRTGQIANYCDHAEHNEQVDQDWVLSSAEELISLAFVLAEAEREDLVELYATRLEAVEAGSPAREEGFSGGDSVRNSRTWRQLQLAQLEHDRRFHPDVLGLMKSEQLRHYVLHLAKIVAALAAQAEGADNREELVTRRIPDLLVFAIKLHTVMGRRLPATGALRKEPPGIAIDA